MTTNKGMVWLAYGIIIARLEERACEWDVSSWLRSDDDRRGSFKWCAEQIGFETKKLKRIFYQRPDELREKLERFKEESYALAEDYDNEQEEKEANV